MMLPRDRKMLDTLVPFVRDRALLLWERATPILDPTPYLLSLPGQVACLRTVAQQQELWAKGRRLTPQGWVVDDPTAIVTRCDGIHRKSNHQTGQALDIALRRRAEVPGRIGEIVWWCSRPVTDGAREVNRLFELVLVEARMLGFSCGCDWSRPDRPHIEIPDDIVI